MLSDGKNDGIVIFYAKDGILYPVGLTEEQIETLNLFLPMTLHNKIQVIKDKPQGNLNVLKGKE